MKFYKFILLCFLVFSLESVKADPAKAASSKEADETCMKTGQEPNTRLAQEMIAQLNQVEVSSGKKVTLDVQKMHCGSCALKVRKAIREASLDDPKEIVVDLDKKQATFTCMQKNCDLKGLVSKLGELGYPSSLLSVR